MNLGTFDNIIWGMSNQEESKIKSLNSGLSYCLVRSITIEIENSGGVEGKDHTFNIKCLEFVASTRNISKKVHSSNNKQKKILAWDTVLGIISLLIDRIRKKHWELLSTEG